jgi:LPS sulfotransferase NodH
VTEYGSRRVPPSESPIWEMVSAAPVSYVVAATPRTGSSLLCDGLTATRVAGRPAEFFAPHLRETWCRQWSLNSTTSSMEYLAAALRCGMSANGVIAFKIHWTHVRGLEKEIGCTSGDALAWLLPEARFVNIVRRDRRAQALSWFRAVETNEWERFDDIASAQPPCAPPLDVAAVREIEGQIDRQQNNWLDYFAARRLQPLTIEYESISNDYRGQIAKTLAFLVLDAAVAERIPPPRRVPQADTLTVSWRREIDSRKR